MRETRNPESVHGPLGPYSHQIEVSGEQRWLVMSGQVGMTQDGQVPDEATAQFGVALDNVMENVKAAGMGPADVVKLIFYVTEDVPREDRGRLLAECFGEHRPAMTHLFIAGLAAPHLKVEIDAWACAD